MSVTEANKKERIDEDEIEIRLGDIIQFLNHNNLRILLGTIIGLLLGTIYAFTKPNMYVAQVTVMPEIQSKSVGGLSGLGSLAGLAGISLDNLNSSDAIRPDLYPNVLESVPFALELLKQPVYSERFRSKMQFQTFIDRIDQDNFLSKIISRGTKEDVSLQADPKNFSKAIQVTKKQDELIKYVRASVSTAYDKKTGIITITANEPDPVVAATIARLSLEYLTNYITTYRTEKSRKQVAFLMQQVSDAKSRYQSAEYNLSAYRDRNRSIFLNTAKIEEQRLQADYNLTQSVYNDLSKQLEQAKIKVQEETPVFKVLEPPTVPLRKSGPKRMMIILGFAIIGTITAIIILTVRVIKHRTFVHVA